MMGLLNTLACDGGILAGIMRLSSSLSSVSTGVWLLLVVPVPPYAVVTLGDMDISCWSGIAAGGATTTGVSNFEIKFL